MIKIQFTNEDKKQTVSDELSEYDKEKLNNLSDEISDREYYGFYNLGELINDLKNFNIDMVVEIDNGTFPMKSKLYYTEEEDEESEKETETVFDSWRGDYGKLSMQFDNNSQNITVGELLKMAEFINNKYLCGYKGGIFLMDLWSDIYIANYGTVGELKLIGVHQDKDKVILKTIINDDY